VAFTLLCGSSTLCQALKKQLRQHNGVLPDASFEVLWTAHGKRWHGWMLLHMAGIGNNGKAQLEHLAFVMRFVGLSRNGNQYLHDLGFLPSVRLTDNNIKMREEAYEESLS
jgi:hypothetical protein